MVYKLVALDVDGTLVPSDLQLSGRVKRAVRRAIDQGTTVTLASGRSLPTMITYVRELGISAPIITHQGCKILLPDTQQVLYNTALPVLSARAVIEYAQRHEFNIVVFVDDHIYVRPGEFAQVALSRLSGLAATITENLLDAINSMPTKLVIIEKHTEEDSLLRNLRHRFGSHIQFVRSSVNSIEAIPQGVSKGKALERVASYLGIAQEETVAIGDADNDAEMVAWAGLGVAMGNATPRVKAVADYIAPPVEEDGAAVAIETFCLDQGVIV